MSLDHIPVPEFGIGTPIEELELSLLKLARSFECEGISRFLSAGSSFQRDNCDFSIIDGRDVRFVCRNGDVRKEYYLLFVTETATYQSSSGPFDSDHLCIHFGVIHSKPKAPADKKWYSEYLTIDTEMAKKTYSKTIERQAAEFRGEAPKRDAIRLASFAIAALIEECADEESVRIVVERVTGKAEKTILTIQ